MLGFQFVGARFVSTMPKRQPRPRQAIDLPNERSLNSRTAASAVPRQEILDRAQNDSQKGAFPVAGALRLAGLYLNAPFILTACQLHLSSLLASPCA
jgi:hypothetical protein